MWHGSPCRVHAETLSTHLGTLDVHCPEVDGDGNHSEDEVGDEEHEEEDHADRKVRRHSISCTCGAQAIQRRRRQQAISCCVLRALIGREASWPATRRRPLRLTETSGSRGMRAGATCVHVDVGDERLDLAELEGRELFDWREVLRTPSRTASAPWSRTEQRAGRCSRRRAETIARIYLNHHGAELLEGGGPLETFILACSDGRLGLRSCHDAAA